MLRQGEIAQPPEITTRLPEFVLMRTFLLFPKGYFFFAERSQGGKLGAPLVGGVPVPADKYVCQLPKKGTPHNLTLLFSSYLQGCSSVGASPSPRPPTMAAFSPCPSLRHALLYRLIHSHAFISTSLQMTCKSTFPAMTLSCAPDCISNC